MKADLAKLRALHEAATPGPWRMRRATSRYHLKADNGDYIIEGGQYCVRAKADGDLIAAMYEALPELLAIAEAVERNAADAKRYRALRDIACCSMSLSCNEEHAPNYMTAAAWIEEFPETFADVPADELDAMKATNTIWTLQIYPNTPVGSNRSHGATMDAAIDRLLAIGEDG